jgi:hypothetical protein
MLALLARISDMGYSVFPYSVFTCSTITLEFAGFISSEYTGVRWLDSTSEIQNPILSFMTSFFPTIFINVKKLDHWETADRRNFILTTENSRYLAER